MEIRSPFPGMDPWLEKHWRDIHTAMITYARDALNPQLPGGLRARMEERVFVESPLQAQGEVYPDVRVVEYRRPEWLAGAGGSAGGGAVGTEPIVIELPAEEISEPYIQIVDTESGNKVITTIEFLSPSNKRKGPGQDQYLEKQRAMRAGQVNLVEVDLLRQGQRVLLVRSAQIPATHRTTYQVCAWRWWTPFKAEVYPVPLRGPLPEVNVPLRQADADAKLNLQELVELAYQNGRYDSIDYTQAPVPPLSPDDEAWADALLRQQKKR